MWLRQSHLALTAFLAAMLLATLLAGMAGSHLWSGAAAAPGNPTTSQPLNQNVDYLGPDSAAALALDFPVLVPPYVPGPFGGEPAVGGGGGFYSLYWIVSGGDPTFLQVTGEVGGTLPAGSPYDLNVELSINASVQGYEAIRDVTSVYDVVWWIAGGVLYKVESRNMSTDSLSLANSLIAFSAPAPDPEPPAEPVEPQPETEPEGDEPPAETVETPDSDADTAPDDDAAPSDTSSEDVSASAPATEPAADPAEEPEAAASASEDVTVEGQPAPAEANDSDNDNDQDTSPVGEEQPASDISSDGTGGPPLPVFGGDGTGGTRDIVVPENED